MASEIGVQTIQHTNGTDAMTIDSSGHVSFAQYPAFFATRSSSYSISDATSTITLDTKQVDTHNGFNTTTHTYTIPKAGLWMFLGNISFTGISASERFIGCTIVVNGSGYADGFTNFNYGATDAYQYATVQAMRECVVGDTVKLTQSSSNSGDFTLNHDAKRTKLMGWFLG